MGNRVLTQEIYNALVAAFREKPYDWPYAAKAAGVDWRTAKRAWITGWEKHAWAPPIQKVVDTEKTIARARLMEEAAKTTKEEVKEVFDLPKAIQKRAMEDATDSRVQEGKLVRLARENTLLLLGSTQHLLRGALKFAPTMAALFSGQGADVEPTVAMRFYAQLGGLVQASSDSARLAIQLERLIIGAPTEIIGVVGNLEDTERELRETLELVEDAKKRGLLGSPKIDATDIPTGGNNPPDSVH